MEYKKLDDSPRAKIPKNPGAAQETADSLNRKAAGKGGKGKVIEGSHEKGPVTRGQPKEKTPKKSRPEDVSQRLPISARDSSFSPDSSMETMDEAVIHMTDKEDDYIDLYTLMNKIDVPSNVQKKVADHRAWKEVEKLGLVRTRKGGEGFRMGEDQVHELFRTLLKEVQEKPAFDLLSRCEAPSRIKSLMVVSGMLASEAAMGRRFFSREMQSRLEGCLEQTTTDLRRERKLKDLGQLIPYCNPKLRASIAKKLLLDPLVHFSKVSSAFLKAKPPIDLEQVWTAALKAANDCDDPAYGLLCLSYQCKELDQMVGKRKIKSFAYRDSIADALDGLKGIDPHVADKIRQRVNPGIASPLRSNPEIPLFSHGAGAFATIEVPGVKPISEHGRLQRLKEIAVEYANALPSEERAKLGQHLHLELDLLLEDGAITDREYSAVLMNALGWTKDV